MNELNLRAIESRSWKAMQQNGLFDLFFGVVLAASALSLLLDELGVTAAIRIGATLALYAAGIAGSWLARKRYVVPRTGTVKLGADRRRRVRQSRLVLAISVILTLALLALITIARFSPADWLGELGGFAPSAMIGLIVLVPLAILAYVLEYPRLVIHAALFVGAEFATVALARFTLIPATEAIAFGSVAVVSLTIGSVVFARFLRSVPIVRRVPSEAEANGQ
ncbi:hypothetical protein ACFLTM_04410 [Candidatus Bipolaricaulota bacterium]